MTTHFARILSVRDAGSSGAEVDVLITGLGHDFATAGSALVAAATELEDSTDVTFTPSSVTTDPGGDPTGYVLAVTAYDSLAGTLETLRDSTYLADLASKTQQLRCELPARANA